MTAQKEDPVKKFAIILLLLTFIFSLTACTPAADPDNDEPTITEKVLTIGTPYTIDTFNPFQYSSDGDRYVIGQVIEALIDSDSGNYYPLLAESWENPDALTWDFKIRDEAYWQTGNDVYTEKTQLTATDVVECWNFVLNPDNEARLQPALAGIIESVEELDGNIVRFTTFEPSAFLLQQINRVPIFSVKAYTQLGLDEFSANPIGSGAFKFSEYRTDDSVTLVKNPDYFIEPKLDKVVFQIIPDKSVAAVALQNGEIDISLQLNATEVPNLRETDGIHVVPNSSGWYRYAAFNFDNPLFQEAAVREAIGMAIDMEAAVDAIFDVPGLALRAPGPVPKGLPGYTDDWFDLWEYNPAKAMTLLEDNGWAKNDDGIYAKDGNTLSFTLKAPNDVNRAKLAVIIATELNNIGMDVTSQPQEWATHLDDIRAGNTEMFIMGGGSTIDGLTYMFYTKDTAGGAHDTRYANDEVDALIVEATKTVDPVARAILWEKAARITIEDRVHISAYYEYVQIGVSDRVIGFDEIPNVWVSIVSTLRNIDVQ